MAKLTKHGARRLRRRLKTGVHGDREYLQRVLTYGLGVGDEPLDGPLEAWLRGKQATQPNGHRCLVYAQALHVFADDRLVTVYRLPGELVEQADRLCAVRRRRLEREAIERREARRASRRAAHRERLRSTWLRMYTEAVDERF